MLKHSLFDRLGNLLVLHRAHTLVPCFNGLMDSGATFCGAFCRLFRVGHHTGDEVLFGLTGHTGQRQGSQQQLFVLS